MPLRVMTKDLRKWKRKMKPVIHQLNFFQQDFSFDYLDDNYYKYLVNYYQSINDRCDRWELVTLCNSPR